MFARISRLVRPALTTSPSGRSAGISCNERPMSTGTDTGAKSADIDNKDKEPEEFNVVVTGFSPWGPGTPWPPIPINVSWLIANAMPRVIFRDKKPNIRFITYPDAVRTSWNSVRSLVPKLWDGEKQTFRLYQDEDKPKTFEVDAVLHIGMLDKPNEAFRIERNAFKGEYKLPDVDGKHPTKDERTGGGTWADLPEKLSTDVDVDYVHKEVLSQITNSKVIISDDPERFLCGYIFWCSLAETFKRGEAKRVLFLHTPIEHQSEDINKGVQVASAVAIAMVDDLQNEN